MPELPEVETIKNDLLLEIIDRRFTKINVLWEKAIQNLSAGEFYRRLVGHTIKDITRRGKYLIFHISNDAFLIIHLRMTGSILLKRIDSDPDPYTRAVFDLDNGMQMRFCDVRKFGVLYLVNDVNSVIGKLGPEPLGSDFNVRFLRQQLSKRTAPVKAVLCDQHLVAGIGNMYADEILHAAHINPLRKADSLTDKELNLLYKMTIRVLESAISHKGATVRDYQTPSGQPGTAQNFFSVAHRLNKKCPTCNTLIKRIRIRNRGTYFCPHCQP